MKQHEIKFSKEHRIEFDEECSSCKGTGLYIGMAESDGAAIICHNCKGTGCHHFVHIYKDFSGRNTREDVKRVFAVNCGVGIGEGVGRSGQRFKLSDFGGMSYIEWSKGKQFPPRSEARMYSCPAWWYQSADSKKKPQWKSCSGRGAFQACEFFNAKEQCWARWDRENGL